VFLLKFVFRICSSSLTSLALRSGWRGLARWRRARRLTLGICTVLCAAPDFFFTGSTVVIPNAVKRSEESLTLRQHGCHSERSGAEWGISCYLFSFFSTEAQRARRRTEKSLRSLRKPLRLCVKKDCFARKKWGLTSPQTLFCFGVSRVLFYGRKVHPKYDKYPRTACWFRTYSVGFRQIKVEHYFYTSNFVNFLSIVQVFYPPFFWKLKKKWIANEIRTPKQYFQFYGWCLCFATIAWLLQYALH